MLLTLSPSPVSRALSELLFNEMKISTIFQVNLLQSLGLMFKCKNNDSPKYFYKFYKERPNNKYAIRSQGTLCQIALLKTCEQFSFSIRGCQTIKLFCFCQTVISPANNFSRALKMH